MKVVVAFFQAILAVSLAGLCGCARFTPVPLSPVETSLAFQSRNLADLGLKAFIEQQSGKSWPVWPPEQWGFPLLTWAAFYFHPSLEVARAEWQVSRAQEITAGAYPNPLISISPGLAANPGRGVSPWLAMVDLEVPIETAGKRRHRLEQARQATEAVRWEWAATAWQVRQELLNGLLEMRVALRRQELWQETSQIYGQLVRRLEAQLAAGALAPAEVASVRLKQTQSQADLASVRRQSVSARARVAAALGVPLSALDGINFDLPMLEMPVVPGPELRQQVLNERPDIRAALARYAAAQAQLQLEIARQYPDVRLGPGYEYDQGENKWMLGLAIELPVRHQNQGPIAEAKARRAAEAARFSALQARILAELEHAQAALTNAQEHLAATREMLRQAASRQQFVQRQLEAGAADQLELLNARLESAATALAHLDSEAASQQAVADLINTLFPPAQLGVENRMLERPLSSTGRQP